MTNLIHRFLGLEIYGTFWAWVCFVLPLFMLFQSYQDRSIRAV
jgi:hypothetical protein